jgi:hypothetical protein
VITYDFVLVDAFDLNLAVRAMMPVVHCTVAVNPAIFGLDDQPQVFASLTAVVKVIEPPDGLTVFVAAPAWAKTRPLRQRTTLAILIPILRFIDPPPEATVCTIPMR